MRVTNHIDAEIGRRLRQGRLVENLTQSDLAKKLDISFQQCQKYENGTNRVSASRLWAISRVLGLPITYFYDGLDDAPIDGTDETMPDDQSIRVAQRFDSIPESAVKDQLFALMKATCKAA